MKKRDVYFAVILIAVILFNIVFMASFFMRPSIVGGATAQGYVYAYVAACSGVQNLSLVQGWNFPSFYANMTNYSVLNVLSSINGNYDYILEWNSSGQQFRIWSRQGLKEFNEFDRNKSYFIFMNQQQNLSLCGNLYNNYTISLLPGWESPNYVYEYPSNFSGHKFYNVSFYYMLKWDNINQKFLGYSPESLNPEFKQINSSEGYFIRSNGGVLVYIRNASA